MDRLRPYKQYKSSEVEGIGEVPIHWKTLRAKYIYKEVDEKSLRGEETLLSVSHYTGVTPRSEKNVSMFLAENYAGSKLCKADDLVINTMWAWMGALGVSKYDGIVSNGYGVYRPLTDRDHSPDYLNYLLRTKAYVALYTVHSKGIHSSRWRLYPEYFLRLPILLPTLPEQKAIATFLDEKTKLIDDYIRKKEQLIELLQERQDALINQTVTKGLDPKAPMKDSGIEWIGQIPAHWEVKKLKTFADFINRGSTPSYTDNGDIKVVNQETFSKGTWNEDRIRFHRSKTVTVRGMLKQQDILLASTGGGVLGKVFLFQNEGSNYMADSHITIIRDSKERFISEFVFLWLSVNFDLINGILAQGSTNQIELQRQRLKDLYFPYPAIEEQESITVYIKKEMRVISDSLELIQSQISLMKEYRESLISEAVTGKIDVRSYFANENLELFAADVQSEYEISHQQTLSENVSPSFKLCVLAAEIINRLYQEPTFGHVKLQKLLYLIEHEIEEDFDTNYHRDAAGPYDDKALRYIDEQVNERQWFNVIRKDKRYHYEALEKAGDHRDYFQQYFSENLERIDFIIGKFKTTYTKQVEIITTLYAAWNDLLLQQKKVTDDLIVWEVLNNWHESKTKISKTQWRKGLEQLKQIGLMPRGTGKSTL